MVVKELITKLEQLDPNLRVFVHGYEGGYHDSNNISPEVEMALNVNDSWYFGDHDLVENLDREQLKDKTIVKGVII